MIENLFGYVALLVIVTAFASIGYYLKTAEGPILQARRLSALLGRFGIESEWRLAALSASIALAQADYTAHIHKPNCVGCKILIAHSKRNLCWVCEVNADHESDLERARR